MAIRALIFVHIIIIRFGKYFLAFACGKTWVKNMMEKTRPLLPI